MRLVVHEHFLQMEKKILLYYEEKSGWAADNFEKALNEAIGAIKSAPTGAGHFIPRKSRNGIPHRRRNLKKFPYFIVYTYEREVLALLRLIPSRSNPQGWFTDFAES